jgi:hypothetical protein
MSVRLSGVLVCLHRVLMGGLMIAVYMVLGCGVVCLCCVLVVFRCFLVPSCAINLLCLNVRFDTPANLRVDPFRLYRCRIKISCKNDSITIPSTSQSGDKEVITVCYGLVLLMPPIYGVSSVLSTTGGVVPVDSAPNRSYS